MSQSRGIRDGSWDLIIDPPEVPNAEVGTTLQLASINLSKIKIFRSFCPGVEILRRTSLFIGFLISFLTTAVNCEHDILNSNPLAEWIRHHLRSLSPQQNSGEQMAPVPLSPVTCAFPIAELMAMDSCPEIFSKKVEAAGEKLS